MRSLSVFAFGLLLSAGQLCAQTADRSARVDDPSATNEPADQAKEHAPAQPEDSFPPVVVASAASAAQQRIERALNRETTFEYLDQPLKDVLEDISYTNNIPIVIDARALEEFGIDNGTPITKSLKGISLRSALRLMLRELQLTFVIRDEVLQITTPAVAESKSSTRYYHVTELLPPNGDGEVLVELIKALIAPATWGDSSVTVRSIIYVEHLESLAIRQTDEVFHEIEELLATTKILAEMQPPRNSIPDSDAGSTIAE